MERACQRAWIDDTFNMGNMLPPNGDDAETVERNRRELMSLAELPSQPF